MNIFYQILILFFLFFILFPVVAISSITIVRLIYRKIKRKENIGIKRVLPAVIIALIGLAIVPPLPYIAYDLTVQETIITGTNGDLKYDDKTGIRSMDIKGKKYLELDRSISPVHLIDISEDAEISFGDPIANVIDMDQLIFIEKYIYKIFRYPAKSLLVYQVENEDMKDFVCLERESIFCDEKTIDDRVAFYSDFNNYNYFALDYDTDYFSEISVSNDSIVEINDLSLTMETAETTELSVDSDYFYLILMGESKDRLFLREFADIYFDDDKNGYMIVSEDWTGDGTVTLKLIPLSKKTSENLSAAFDRAGI